MASETKPRVLVLGGTGFIGRNFVQYIVENAIASKIRVADKVPPQMAWLNAKHKQIFSSPIVEFKHSNLINPGSVTNAFTDPSGSYDYVVNLAAETKYGQSSERIMENQINIMEKSWKYHGILLKKVYKEGIVRLSLNCAKEAAKQNVRFYIEVSSGQMASSDKKAVTEDTKCDPWTNMAVHKLEVEKELKSIPNLRFAIVRPAIVYGLGDKNGLAPRLIIGAIYKYIRQKMKMLWTKDLKMHTIHVEDLCSAIWYLLQHGISGGIYNCVDQGETTQGKVSDTVSEVFGISYEFVGSVMSNLARVNMSHVVEDINEKHMTPWADACTRDNLQNTSLTPFIDQELLYNKHLNLDGSKLEKLGFVHQKPALQTAYLKEILDDYIQMGLFPKSLLSDDILYTVSSEHENGDLTVAVEDLNDLSLDDNTKS